MLAATKPLLKSAVCALSAKHLRHIQQTCRGKETPPGNSRPHQAVNDGEIVDWHYESARHYHRAIRHLKTAIELRSFETDDVDREELFTAIAILCAYELMDAPGTAWRAHLSALPLFSSPPETNPSLYSPVAIPRAAISGPIFWSLARQDLLCACIARPFAFEIIADTT